MPQGRSSPLYVPGWTDIDKGTCCSAEINHFLPKTLGTHQYFIPGTKPNPRGKWSQKSRNQKALWKLYQKLDLPARALPMSL